MADDKPTFELSYAMGVADRIVDELFKADAIERGLVVGVILPPDSDDLVTYTDFVLSTNELDWWSCDQFGWVLRDVRALPTPIPAVGHQGIWYWDVLLHLEAEQALGDPCEPSCEAGR